MNKIKIKVRSLIAKFARLIDGFSAGRITPNFVTYFGLVGFLLVGYLIIVNQNILAAIFLIIFGLFDTLDGELARLQKTDSPKGMLLDASTDRLKEVILFAALAFQIVSRYHQPIDALVVVLALGTSILISYVKAKGEAILANQDKNISHQQLNRIFGGGLMSYEFRTVIVIVALFFNLVIPVLVVIIVLGTYTYLLRFFKIMKYLSSE
jgi:phosphatidylglycerophosphate synthase